MALVRCPSCGRVADGKSCFACGHEWTDDAATPLAPAGIASVSKNSAGNDEAAHADVSVDIDIDVDFDVGGDDARVQARAPELGGEDQHAEGVRVCRGGLGLG